MRKISAYYSILTIIIFCSSCSPKFYYQTGYIESDLPAIQDATNSEVYIETRFSGDAIDYLIFEIDIDNNSDKDIPLAISDITLVVYDHDLNERSELYPLDKSRLLSELEATRREIKNDKKARNITNIISIGLSIVAVGASGNAYDAINAATYATDVTTNIILDNRSYALMDEDIEIQSKYIDEWVLEDVIIPPRVKTSYDVILPRTLINGDAMLNIKNESILYTQDFVFEIVEQKM